MMPFEKMTVSSALKKAIHEAVIKLPWEYGYFWYY
jgi:hypothetical protein